ncbi:MAG: methionyl-tRNA formyltransferase, partial [Actinobacteria bacterium]|nr:methionyl-tRNA formyltransferase [Actinomycetota bacterium]
MRVAFAGTPAVAVPTLRALLDSPRHEVVAAITRPPARAGRGRRTASSPVADLAAEAGVPVLAPQRAGDPDFLTELAALGPDCCPVVAYGALLPRAALDVAGHGWVNLHFSLLPAWRGAAP